MSLLFAKVRRTLFLFSVLALVCVHASAQSRATDGATPAAIAPGAPTGSYSLSGFDNVNLFNGRMNFQLPLLNVGGRGAVGYRMTLTADRNWIVDNEVNEITKARTYYPEPESWNAVKPGYGPGVLLGRMGGDGSVYCGQFSPWYRYTSTLTRLTFITSDGTEYELRDQATAGQPKSPVSCSAGFNRGKVFVSADGSATTFISDADIIDGVVAGSGGSASNPSGILLLRDGTRYRIDSGVVTWARDRNGNTLSFTYDSLKRVTAVTDSLGRQVTVAYATQTPGSDTITYKGFGQTNRVISVNYDYMQNALRADQTLQTPKQLFPELNGMTTSYFGPVVVASVTLPNNRQYQLRYNSYGELARVVMPTGGAVEYDYMAGLTDGAADGVMGAGHATKQIYRRIVERRLYPTGGTGASYESKTTYSRPEAETTSNSSTVITDQCTPSGTTGQCGGAPSLLERQYHYFYGSPRDSFFQGPTAYPGWGAGKEYQTDVYNTDGTTLLRRMVNTFAQRAPVSWWTGVADSEPPNDVRLVGTVTTLADASLMTKRSMGYDQFNNVTDVWEYGYGTGAAPAYPFRHTHTDYLTVNPANSIDYTDRNGAHIRNLLRSLLIYSVNLSDGTETLVSRSETLYDESAYATLSDYASVIQWNNPGTARGNATTTRKWLDTAGGWVETHAQYDQCGNTRNSWDAKGNFSQAGYADSFADGVGRNTYAFVTSVISPVPDPSGQYASNTPMVKASVYDYGSGLRTAATDPNGKTTTYSYTDDLGNLDPLDRVRKVTAPDGGWTKYDYDNNQYGDYVRTRVLKDNSGAVTESYNYFDGLGRPYRSFGYENSDPSKAWLTVDTEYDALSRVKRVSRPYRSVGSASAMFSSGVWTEKTYDALGRVATITTKPDNSVVSTTYSGNRVTVIDQAGKRRDSYLNVFGRLDSVVEDPLGAAYLTTYSYDALGNLRTVTQGSPSGTQQRYFMYDSLGRLIRVKYPEQAAGSIVSNMTDSVTGNSQWSMAYGYDNNGNLTARVDARGVTASYTYDALNRDTTVRYSDGTKDIDRHYDGAINGKGLFYYSNWDPSNNTRFDTHLAIDEYDEMGRVKKYRQHFLTNGVASPQFLISRTYDVAGRVKTETYPSGHTVTYDYDTAGRLNSFAGNLGDGVQRTYSTGISYSELGGLQQEQFGTQVPLYRKLHYNVRGQLFDTRLSTVPFASDQWNWDRGALLNYYSAAELTAPSNAARSLSGTGNNGDLVRAGTYVPLSTGVYTEGGAGSYVYYQDDYAYDALNRLSSVTETAGGTSIATTTPFKQSYTYDRFGNRTINAGQTFGVAAPQFELSPATNQEVAEPSNRLYAPGDAARSPSQKLMRYDAAGNLVYDAQTGQGARAYDAENRLIQAQDVYQNWSYYTYDAEGRRVKRKSANQETWQVYGPEGGLLAEYRAGAAPFVPTKEYGYRGSELLVSMSSGDDQRIQRFVNNLYYNALARNASATELQQKTDQLAQAGVQGEPQLLAAAKSVARGLFESTEYAARNRTNTQYVTDLYNAYLQRAPDTSGLNFWVQDAQNNGRGHTLDSFEVSTEFATLAETIYGTTPAGDNQRVDHFIDEFYLGAYNRFPTSTERQQQEQRLNNAAVSGQAQVTAEARLMGAEIFQATSYNSTHTDAQYVTDLYEAFLQRAPDGPGLSFWVSKVQNEGRASALVGFQNSIEFGELAGTLYRETFWLVSDHLGTTRMVVDRSGSLAGIKRHDYLPFGEELLAGVGGRATSQGYNAADNVRQKFTGHEHDGETGLDYARARYFSEPQGRFVSPDPLLASGKLAVPQSWNRYTYVLNNPLVLVDPDGLIWGSKPGESKYRWFDTEDQMKAAGYTAISVFLYLGKDGRYYALNPNANQWKSFDNAWDAERTYWKYTGLTPSWQDWIPVWGNFRRMMFNIATENYEGAMGGFVLTAVDGGTVFGGGGAGKAAEKGLVIASEMGGEVADMAVVRTISKGEKIADIIAEVKGLTWDTANEHAVVTLANGDRAIVSGGPGGIHFAEGQVSRIWGHVHPDPSLPSIPDLTTIRRLGNSQQTVISMGRGGAATKLRSSGAQIPSALDQMFR